MLPELSADVARSDTELGQLHNPQPDVVGQRPPVDKNSSQLVDLAVRVDVGLWRGTTFYFSPQLLIKVILAGRAIWDCRTQSQSARSELNNTSEFLHYFTSEIFARFATLISSLQMRLSSLVYDLENLSFYELKFSEGENTPEIFYFSLIQNLIDSNS